MRFSFFRPSLVSLSSLTSCFPLPTPTRDSPSSSSSANANANNAHRVTDLDRAVLQLKTQRRQLEGAAARTARLVEREREAAAAAIASAAANPRARETALAALRRKKLHEARLAAVDSYLLNVEAALAGIDDARATASVAAALRAGADALKNLRAAAPLAEVEAILADSRAAAEYEASMAKLLENAGTGLDAAQEEEAAEELEALVSSEEAREEAARLPEAPRHEAEKRKEGEEEEALRSAPTGVVPEGAGGERKEKERVPVLA